MLLGLQCCLSGTDKGEVRYSLSQNDAPVCTFLTTWTEWSPVIGLRPGENLEGFFAAFRSTRTLTTIGSAMVGVTVHIDKLQEQVYRDPSALLS
jgi:hypothetical protein